MASFFLIRLLIAVSAGLLAAAGDLELLLHFKASLPSPEVIANWVDGANVCGFTGVECGPGGAVTGLDLSYGGLFVGLDVVAESLLRVEGLQWLSLRSANVTGNLTAGASGGGGGCGRHLADLDISGNAIYGEVSEVFSLVGFCQTLKYLNLSGNRLLSLATRQAVAETKLSLKSLDLSRNRISGEGILPAVLAGAGGCGELKFLSIAGNSLSGAIPPSTFAGCAAMEHLDLSDNQLAGEVVAQLAGCGNLTFLSLAGNELSGEIPASPNLKQLNLSYNNFAGDLPGSLFRLADLERLDLSSNNVTGSIPTNLCGGISSNRLQLLHLQNNRLFGEIPATVGNCSGLVSLDLSFNYLTGTIPSTIGRLRLLRDLILWLNILHGPIPGELANLRSLENLILDDNELTGGIPDGLRNCANLYWLSLSGNKLIGRIPTWIGDLAHLAILKLGSNSFSGEIPPEIGDCKSLVWLDLNSNRLSGPIPAALAKQSGKIAAGVVTSMNYAYLKNNGRSCRGAGNLFEFDGIRQQQTYRVPSMPACNSTIYYGMTKPSFVNNGSLLFLDLSYNRLEGGIPKELGAMVSIFVLNLGHNRLAGSIPDELGGMRFCSILDLSYNFLSGNIPGSVDDLAMLSEIHLSNNNLTGPIPQSGKLITFSPDFFANNSGLCGLPLNPCGGGGGGSVAGDGASRRRQSHRRPASLAGSVAIGLLFALLTILALVLLATENKKRRRRRLQGNGVRRVREESAEAVMMSVSLTSFAKPLRKLTFADLVEATNNFDDGSRVGSGGFGDVYKAKLKDGTVVAVKKLVHITGQGDKEFTAEMDTIGKIRHRNLVPLLGYCKAGEERLLVYQYMKHGSLEDVLHGRSKSPSVPRPKLNWPARRRIAVGAARGLAFLHHSCVPHIIHRDMKSSNVLVDENLEARVSDFGMARMMSSDVDTHLSVSTLAGTPGYVPPEYYQSFQCSTKGDVYSFGVVLLELLTGRRPTDASEFGDNNNLVGWVKQHAKLRIRDVFDKALLKEDASVEVELLQHLEVACACLDDRPRRRPSMIQVLATFKEIQAGGGDSGGSSFGLVEVVKISRVEEDCEV